MSRAAPVFPTVFTPATLAERWECSERHIRNMVASGLLPKLDFPLIRISLEAVLDIEEGRSIIGEPSGVVYFVAADHLVKIGYTTNLETRLRDLTNMSAVPVQLLGSMPGNVTTERRLHERFAEYRAHGEWFRPDGRLGSFLKREIMVEEGP